MSWIAVMHNYSRDTIWSAVLQDSKGSSYAVRSGSGERTRIIKVTGSGPVMDQSYITPAMFDITGVKC